MEPRFGGNLADGNVFVITASSSTALRGLIWRVYLGPQGALREYQVLFIEILRDGGTTYLEFGEGNTVCGYFHRPARLNERESAELVLYKEDGSKEVQNIVQFWSYRDQQGLSEFAKSINCPTRIFVKSLDEEIEMWIRGR